MSNIPEPCEDNCIMHLVDPACELCMAWYQYWADVDSSDDPYPIYLFLENIDPDTIGDIREYKKDTE